MSRKRWKYNDVLFDTIDFIKKTKSKEFFKLFKQPNLKKGRKKMSKRRLISYHNKLNKRDNLPFISLLNDKM
jgi:hypothetical protein